MEQILGQLQNPAPAPPAMSLSDQSTLKLTVYTLSFDQAWLVV